MKTDYASVTLVEKGRALVLVKSLPLWPTLIQSGPLITAKRALIAKSPRLLVPWMFEYERFTDPIFADSNKSFLQSLGVEEVTEIDLIRNGILPNLPRNISTCDEKGYLSLIGTISDICAMNYPSSKSKDPGHDLERLQDILRLSKLAPDGHGVLRATHELFDHHEPVFMAAFRNTVESKFIHKDFWGYRKFWIDIGLTHLPNKRFAPKDYILCLKTIRQRIVDSRAPSSDETLMQDTLKVLEPLTTSNSRLADMTANHWCSLIKETAFPAMAKLDDQPVHRRSTMAFLAVAIPFLTLDHAIQKRYIPICWSQTSFPTRQPSLAVYGKQQREGKPLTSMVWKHLEHLQNSVATLVEDQVPVFLDDLHATYNFLQENLDESTESFTQVTSPLWLNLDVTDPKLVSIYDLKRGWSIIEHLVLSSSCDAPPLQSAREGLMRYERLLSALGCRRITYPTIAAPDINTTPPISSYLSQMRKNEDMIDVTLVADGGILKAHKVVLAAVSDFFKTHFKENWVRDEIEFPDISHSVLSIIVDFAYTDAFDWTPMRVVEEDDVDVIADKLDNFLDLLAVADRFMMPTLATQVENQVLLADRAFIRVDNVLGIQARAGEVRAHKLENACAEFYRQNKATVDLANGKTIE